MLTYSNYYRLGLVHDTCDATNLLALLDFQPRIIPMMEWSCHSHLGMTRISERATDPEEFGVCNRKRRRNEALATEMFDMEHEVQTNQLKKNCNVAVYM